MLLEVYMACLGGRKQDRALRKEMMPLHRPRQQAPVLGSLQRCVGFHALATCASSSMAFPGLNIISTGVWARALANV